MRTKNYLVRMQTSDTPFRSFFLRLWLWHLLITAVLALVTLLCFMSYTDLKAGRGYAWANVIVFLAGSVHTLILLILSVRLLARNRWLHGVCFALHFFVSSAVVYWAYLLLVGAFFAALLD
ncbi:MAG: hypothetical protein MUC87_08050 [Bacteroidia bacterium]|jgi:hypothetical protein|nr:hypothetical protein [Bacteroidia bacterium]